MSAPVSAPAPSHATSGQTVVNPISGHDLTAKQTAAHNYDEILKRSTNKDDKHVVVREVVPGIVTFSIPFARAGAVPIGGRSTAIRHGSGNVLIYVSSPHTPATAEILEGLGEVKWLVTPDGEHGISFEQYIQAYPNAMTIGVPRLKAKMPKVKWTGIFGEGGETQQYGFEDEMSIHRVSGHVNDELVLHHAPSGTLIQADMLFNLPPTEQYSRAGGIPGLMKMMGGGSTMSPDGWVHQKMAFGMAKDKDAFKKEIAPINALKWDRIIPCHGDVIETGGKVAWDKVWGKYSA
ncbi:uncharacterized protein MKK02DRAFT_44910 [Dioszegia hungarica]|uniref:Uncharacterized protein n=1 Tax=Dioszegia hungarica TaxID=4972 RepID=A0AA38HC33_9TREE|nr:uncharacterized protein MKK02DRAFT_44910 [Dioszegia hungarica]KAI9636206.1 hypothetical protein MKK02DRAFT_44910 [Dioszegia hungarica]